MKKIVLFFKTSPHSKRGLTAIVLGFSILAIMLITGGIYEITTHPKNFGVIPFIVVSCVLLTAGIRSINPKSFDSWFAETLPPDDSRLDG